MRRRKAVVCGSVVGDRLQWLPVQIEGVGERVVKQLVVDEGHYSSAEFVSVGTVHFKPRHCKFAFRMKFSFTDCSDVYVVSL